MPPRSRISQSTRHAASAAPAATPPRTHKSCGLRREKSQIKWNPDLEKLLVTELLAQTHLGQRADSGWTKEAWEIIAATASD